MTMAEMEGLPGTPGADNQEPQAPTAPPPPAEEPAGPAGPPIEDTVELKIEDERYQLPRTTVQDIAERFGVSERDAVAILQRGRDTMRHYDDIRYRSAEIARREAEIASRERAMQSTQAQPPKLARPSVKEDPLAFWEWTADRLEKIETVTRLEERLNRMEEAAVEQREEQERIEQFEDSYARFMESLPDGAPRPSQRNLARTALHYGLHLKENADLDEMVEAAYRLATYGVPSRAAPSGGAAPRTRTGPPGGTSPPPRPRPPAGPGMTIPRSSGAPGTSGPRPGETLEQRRDRLMNSEVANMTWQQLQALENQE